MTKLTSAVAVPIYQTTSYQFNNHQQANNLFTLQELGNIYSRIPRIPLLQYQRRELPNLKEVLQQLLYHQDSLHQHLLFKIYVRLEIISFLQQTYTVELGINLKILLNNLGIEVRFADPKDPKNFEDLTDNKTRAYYAETLPNPKLHVFPIEEVADIGKQLGIPLIVDNTAAPLTCKPIDHGGFNSRSFSNKVDWWTRHQLEVS